MAAKKKTRRRPAGKPAKKPIPAWLWLVAGILIGLGLATFALLRGYIPQPESEQAALPTPQTVPRDTGDSIVKDAGADDDAHKPRYDFFTVLPEMEVVVPDQEIREQARSAPISDTGPYVLQVGSFRSGQDADGLKARLALEIGVESSIQTVTVNGATWHRVRLGPFDNARAVEEMQRRLRDNGIDSRAFRDQ